MSTIFPDRQLYAHRTRLDAEAVFVSMAEIPLGHVAGPPQGSNSAKSPVSHPQPLANRRFCDMPTPDESARAARNVSVYSDIARISRSRDPRSDMPNYK
jgi:hypothetical protein